MKLDENMLCPICKAKLFTDEVAYCPECGAPHHKSCYLEKGECAYAEFHGTENQWQPPKIEAPKAQEKDEEQEENKTQIPPQFQGRFNQSGAGENPFFEANGIDKNENIGGETAESIAKFVGYNALRYINVFRKFEKFKTKINWNWTGFLFPEYWLISRKCYSQAILIGFYSVLFSIFYSLGMESSEVNDFLQSGIITKNVMSIAFVLFILSAISIVIKLFVGLFGDYIYKKKVYSSISQMKSEGRTSEIDFIHKGGVNLMLPIVLYFVLNRLTFLISTFF